MEAIKVSKTRISAALATSFPNYTGRRFRIRFDGQVRLSDINWSGGTRSEYALVRLGDGARRALVADAPWYEDREGAVVRIPAGFAVVEHSVFCGEDAGITVHANPADAPQLIGRLLPAPNSEPASAGR